MCFVLEKVKTAVQNYNWHSHNIINRSHIFVLLWVHTFSSFHTSAVFPSKTASAIDNIHTCRHRQASLVLYSTVDAI